MGRGRWRWWRQSAHRSPSQNDVLFALYGPDPSSRDAGILRRFPVGGAPPTTTDEQRGPRASDSDFPLPPAALMTMRESASQYLASGRRMADAIRNVVEANDIDLAKSRVMDWGCASGRILRHFAPEAHSGQFWGVDPYENCIEWARRRLSPPFRFATCGNFGHLPFPDASFDLIYGLSVMTHLVHFRDASILELRRLLRPNGLALLTVWDDDTLATFQQNGTPEWWPENVSLEDAGLADHELVLLQGPHWGMSHVFYHRSYITRAWAQYLDIVEFIPRFYTETDQTLVVMRRAS